MKIAKEIFCDVDIATLLQCIKFIKEILLYLEQYKLFHENHVILVPIYNIILVGNEDVKFNHINCFVLF